MEAIPRRPFCARSARTASHGEVVIAQYPRERGEFDSGCEVVYCQKEIAGMNAYLDPFDILLLAGGCHGQTQAQAQARWQSFAQT